MTNQHPLTPPPELIEQWWNTMPGSTTKCLTKLATLAAQWGSDQRGAVNEAELQKARDEELEACCHEVQTLYSGGSRLRARRRPEPPTLKERIAAAITAGDEHTALSLLNEALPNG